MSELLNIVDENDEIIGVATRTEIHEKGHLHREVSIQFITKNNEIILQHRGKNKDLSPDLLSAAVAGHVVVGDSYEETAIKEIVEETGLMVDGSELIFIHKVNKLSNDISGKVNHVFQARYLYIYDGDINDLKVEAEESEGFEVWPIDSLLNLNEADKKKFVPSLLHFVSNGLAQIIKDLK
jgi:isopentenyldiphosphate isomerase